MDNRIVCVEDEKVRGQADSKSKFNLTKLFTKKNLKILILIIVAIVCMLIFMIDSSGNSDDNSSTSIQSTNGYTTTLEYCSELESKLQAVLSSVKGAGEVKVMITVDGSPELVYAKDEDEKVSSNSSGTTTTSSTSSPIIVTVNGGSNALILTENLPNVKGVIVVSSGADDVSVKLDILTAVSRLLDISIDQVTVLKGV